ncbi:MAG: Ig domain-containing protein [Myxococcota bacterium]
MWTVSRARFAVGLALLTGSLGCEDDATPSNDAGATAPQDGGVEVDLGVMVQTDAGDDASVGDTGVAADQGASDAGSGGDGDAGAALSIVTSALPSAAQNDPYQAALVAAGGGPDYRWSVISGSLPTGLALIAEGTPSTTLFGRPEASGTFDFEVRVRDGLGMEATQALSLVVTPSADAPPALTGGRLPDGCVGMSYMTSLTATASGALVWTVIGGALPGGLALDPTGQPNGILRGTPTAAGPFNFTARAEDSRARRNSAQYSLEVVQNCLPVVDIVAQTLPPADPGVGYEVLLQARGGAGSFTWSVVSGSLPPGLGLQAGGRIMGTPRTAGTYSFRVEARDSGGSFDQEDFVIVVGA